MNIKEITTVSQREYNPRRSDFIVYYIDWDNTKPLPGGSGYRYEVRKEYNGVGIYIYDPRRQKEIVGNLVVNYTSNILPKTAQVSSIAVHPAYRGQNIAKSLYGLVLLPKPTGLSLKLISDSVQTQGGQRNWSSLSRIPGVDVTGLIQLRKAGLEEPKDPQRLSGWHMYLQDPEVILKIATDLFEKVGGVYYGETKDYAFYQIPVDVVGSTLDNKIKNSMIKIYHKNDVKIGYNSLLLAEYTGN